MYPLYVKTFCIAWGALWTLAASRLVEVREMCQASSYAQVVEETFGRALSGHLSELDKELLILYDVILCYMILLGLV